MPAMDTLLFNDPGSEGSRLRSPEECTDLQAFGRRMLELLANAAMSAKADEACKRPLRGARRGARQLAQRLPGAGARPPRATSPQDSEAAPRLVLPEHLIERYCRALALSSRRWPRCTSWDIDAQGGGCRGRARREVDVEVAGAAPVRVPGRRGGRVQEAALRRVRFAYLWPGRHLREVPRGGALGVQAVDRDRARRHQPSACRRGLRGHGEPRRVEGVPLRLRARGVDGVAPVVSDAHEAGSRRR